MDFLSPLLGLVKDLWGLASKPLSYIYNLKDNVDSLRKATGRLKDVSSGVKERVEREEEETGAQRTNQVANWLGKVQEFEGGVDRALQEAGEHDRIKCLSRCLPRNCRVSYKLGKRVDQLLNESRELQHEKGEFSDLTSLLPPPPQVLEMPMEKPVGLDSSLDKVWKWLMDEKKVGVIGLYGKGGVGKTTLMRRINEKLLHANHEFEVVIWVVVSKQVNEDSIRDAIRKRLHIRDKSWDDWSRDEKVHHLCHVLARKKFMLLIDDVWHGLDLSNIGVPRPGLENKSKVVFTTRLKHVCNEMRADQTLEVHCLTSEEALKLFEKNIGKLLVDCHQEIQDLVKDVAEECKGLPLALITVGRAMARKDNPGEWRHALTTLRNNPYKMSGMVEEVYHILEFSYNNLNNSTIWACFLYVCLFPEDYPIITNELIELWIGEGLLGELNDVYCMRDRGEYVLGDLKRACLLESGCDDNRQQYVKIHDVIRDMATWIALDRGQRENKLLVIEKDEGMSARMISKWGEAEKVSLWGEWIRTIDREPPRCSQLETLFVRKTNVRLMPYGFFNSMMACLTILDMSCNRNLRSFPEGICNLINLRYLNLSATDISELPSTIKNLTRLQWLLLDDTIGPFIIPTGTITSLPLNVFSWQGRLFWSQSGQVNEEEIIKELGCMQDLIDLSIMVVKSSSALKILQSSNLQRCIRRAWITDSQNGLTNIVISFSPASNEAFLHLEVLHLYDCLVLEKMEITQEMGRVPNRSCFPSLVTVHIRWCRLLDLSWLMHAPILQELKVVECDSMEKIIGDGFTPKELAASGLFSRLKTLEIDRLLRLTSICDQTLPFPQGASFSIFGCPGLRKLPLDSNSARRRFLVKGDADWLAKFEWDRDAWITLKLDKSTMEMTFGEAVRKLKDEAIGSAMMEFGT